MVWAVLWRDADDGRQTSRTFPDPQEVRLLKDFLDANGNSFALAAQAAGRLHSQAPTVAAIVEEHIDGLTGVLPGTRSKYQRMAAKHITRAWARSPSTRSPAATSPAGSTTSRSAARLSATSMRSSPPPSPRPRRPAPSRPTWPRACGCPPASPSARPRSSPPPTCS